MKNKTFEGLTRLDPKTKTFIKGKDLQFKNTFIPEVVSMYTKSIQISKWCVNCYPKRTWACFTHKGNSLCEKCFIKVKK